MIKEGYGGRGASYYSEGEILKGIEAEPGLRRGTNPVRIIKVAPYSIEMPHKGTYVWRCGMCRRPVWPRTNNESHCRCDYSGVPANRED